MDQINLVGNMVEFNDKSRPKQKKKRQKRYLWMCKCFYEGRELSLNAFISEIFSIKVTRKKTQNINF